MDDLIYFLLIVGWLAFSLFNNQKKKAKKNIPGSAQPSGQFQPKTLEEILLGPVIKPYAPVQEPIPSAQEYSLEQTDYKYESLETIDDSEAKSSLETYNSDQKYDSPENMSLEEQYMSLNALHRVSLADERVSIFKQSVFHDEVIEEAEEETFAGSQNWRQAIIYSTLLERKYC